jgi:uncharacterized protein
MTSRFRACYTHNQHEGRMTHQNTGGELDVSPHGLGQIALAFAIGLAGAELFQWLHLPLPWFLGSLLACMAAAVMGVPYARPEFLSVAMRAVLGVAVGTGFTPAILSRLGDMSLSLALLLPWMVLIMATGVPFFRRFAGFDTKTAFFASVPGGLTDMVSMAESAGANTRAVTLIQLTRIVMIVFALPFWLQWHDGFDIATRAVTGRIHIWDLQLGDSLILIVLGAAGWWVANRIGLAGPAIVGPMILSGVAHAGGLTDARMPFEVMTFAQVTLGILLGSQFRGLTWTEFRTTLVWGIAFSVALIVTSAMVTLGVAKLTSAPVHPVLLGYAPGGQAELNLVAYTLNLDVAFVALHHLVRLAIVIFGAQMVFKFFKANK